MKRKSMLKNFSIRDYLESSTRFLGIPQRGDSSQKPAPEESKKIDQAHEDEEFWRNRRLKVNSAITKE